jgi:hypothetical protein
MLPGSAARCFLPPARWHHRRHRACAPPQGLDCVPGCRVPGELVLDYFSAERYGRMQCLGLLALFVAGHRLLFVAALRLKDGLAGRAWRRGCW